MPGLLPVLLAIHITLALALFLPSLLLPFALHARRAVIDSRSPVVRGLLWLQSGGGLALAAGVALSGGALVLAIGTQLLGQPWLLVALSIYVANLAIALFIQQPGLRQLVGLQARGDDRVWLVRARRQRYVSYAMAGLTGAIGMLMSAKPDLW